MKKVYQKLSDALKDAKEGQFEFMYNPRMGVNEIRYQTPQGKWKESTIEIVNINKSFLMRVAKSMARMVNKSETSLEPKAPKIVLVPDEEGVKGESGAEAGLQSVIKSISSEIEDAIQDRDEAKRELLSPDRKKAMQARARMDAAIKRIQQLQSKTGYGRKSIVKKVDKPVKKARDAQGKNEAAENYNDLLQRSGDSGKEAGLQSVIKSSSVSKAVSEKWKKIYQKYSEGKSPKQIADEMGLDEKEVDLGLQVAGKKPISKKESFHDREHNEASITASKSKGRK